MTEPFLKWAGSKRFLAPEILKRLPDKIGTYYEPFLGGGAVFFALASEKRFRRAVIGDANGELVATYRAVAEQPKGVIPLLHFHAKNHSKDYYYHVRSTGGGRNYTVAARMIYLNRTCFNGLYRVNRKGQFNVPMGSYKNPRICDEEGILAASRALANATIIRGDFEALIAKARAGSVVYCDPPYAPLSSTSDFTSFTAEGFGEHSQVRLRDVAAKLVERGVHVLLSNSDTPFVRKLYQGFRIENVRVPRRINSKGDKRGDVGEVLISGRRT